ncbi:MAG: response regulator [Campylobacterales bacterium]
MRKILIVDDNSDNRMTLELLLEEFDDVKVLSAKNGKEALKISQEELIDIIFMDIMMPVMDGIEATKQIRALHPKIMIIAVSALDDETSKEEMIRSGCEDYITKPIDANVFEKRVKNYLELTALRNKEPYDDNAINLFSKEVFNRYTMFRIYDKSGIAEAWEYFLADGDKKVASLSDCIRIVYAISAFLLEKGRYINIAKEESSTNMFITLIGVEIVDEVTLRNILVKHYPDGKFILEDRKLSFMLNKVKEVIEVVEASGSISSENKEILRKTHTEKVSATEFLEQTPLNVALRAEELDELSDNLDATLFEFERSKNTKLLNAIAEIFHSYALVMEELLEFAHLSHSIFTLEKMLLNIESYNVDDDKMAVLIRFLDGFISDLTTWQKTLFITKDTQDIHYLDSSLLSSVLQIENLLEGKAQEDDGEDDIEFF